MSPTKTETTLPTRALVALAMCGIGTVVWWLVDSTMVVFRYIPTYDETYRIVRLICLIVMGILIAVCLTLYDSPDRTGQDTHAAFQTRAMLEYVGYLFLLGAMIYFSLNMILALAPNMPTAIRGDASSINDDPLWLAVLFSFESGLIEEAIVIALGYRLLEMLPWTVGGKQFALTGWATAVLVIIRAGYHTYLGLSIVGVMVIGWLSVRMFRHTRLILPLIVGHVVWDLAQNLIPMKLIWQQAGAELVISLVCVVVGMALTRGPDNTILLGFKGKNPKATDHAYWARWRWESVPHEGQGSGNAQQEQDDGDETPP